MSPVGAHVTEKVSHLWSGHIRPEVKEDFIAKDSVRTGFVSCPATAFSPEDSLTDFYMNGSRRYSTTSPVSVFYCNANLPHGAKVRSVKLSMYDSVSPDYVSCGLTRRNLVTHNEADMGGAFTDESTGKVVRTDTTIDKPTVNNKKFTYALRCAVFGTTQNTGFYGASVGYRMKATVGTGT